MVLNMRFRFLERFLNKNTPDTPLFLYNTLGKEKQEFILSAPAKTVRMYNCGPTVYDVQHIGNLSMFVFADILRRTLEYNGLTVKQVINITDVGHLTSDADEGEDRMTKGLKREGKKLTLENMRELGERYTQIFLDDLRKLNIDTSRITFPRASDYIPAQIAMITTLQEKGYAYTTGDGVYFDTSRFPAYGALGGVNIEGQKEGARVAIKSEKRNAADFALWKLDSKLGWDSPWGKGFPGWHIECSAMIRAILGEQIDIHTGGIEHIGVHHNNEIAQSEAATGKKPFVRFWMHRAHVQLEGAKLAKSKGNVVYLSEICERDFHPLALRYLFLGAHYRTSSNFTWEALGAAQTALGRLLSFAREEGGTVSEMHRRRFHERLNDDLDTPGALALLWEMTGDGSLSHADISATLRDADRVLGIGLSQPSVLEILVKEDIKIEDLPLEVALLVNDRERARADKEWTRSDELREKIADAGYDVSDTTGGPEIRER